MQRAITPQAVRWCVLAALIALAALAVLRQAAARQFSTDTDDHSALSALRLRGRQFVLLRLARALVIWLACAAGAVALAAALSPLTPVGEAPLAAPHPRAVSVDPLVTLIRVPRVVAAVLLLSSSAPSRMPAPPALAGAASRARPVRGPRRGRYPRAAQRAHPRPVRAVTCRAATRPRGSALLRTVLAVTALRRATVFGQPDPLIHSPALYGRRTREVQQPDRTAPSSPPAAAQPAAYPPSPVTWPRVEINVNAALARPRVTVPARLPDLCP